MTNRGVWLAPLFVAAYCFGYYMVGERVPVHFGLGWDGVKYALGAQHGPEVWTLYENMFNAFWASRVFPSFLLHYTAKLIGIQLDTPPAIIRAFVIYNSVLLTLSAALWIRIAQKAKLSTAVVVIGFISLFVNWGNLVFHNYYPVLTDSTAFFFGMLMLLLHLGGHWVLICALLPAVAFTWPSAVYVVLPLAIFLEPGRVVQRRRDYNTLFAIAVTALALVFHLISYYEPYECCGQAPIFAPLFPLSLAISLLYVFLVVKLSAFAHAVPVLERTQLLRFGAFACAAAAYFALYTMVCVWYKLPESSLDFLRYASSLFTLPVVKPAAFLIAHALYFGPIVILAVMFFRQWIIGALKTSSGLYLSLLLTLVMALDTESRHLVFSLPMLVFAVCRAIEDLHPRLEFVIIYAAAALLMSKVFLPINLAPFEGRFMEFPFQFYYMHHGPWMSWIGYFLQLGLALLGFAMIVLAARSARKAQGTAHVAQEP